MRDTARPRHHVGPTTLRLAGLLMRYSPNRDAYVLRGVGNRFGPVLKLKRTDT